MLLGAPEQDFPQLKKFPERQTRAQIICAKIHQYCELSEGGDYL